MKKPRIAILIVGVLLLSIGGLGFGIVMAYASSRTTPTVATGSNTAKQHVAYSALSQKNTVTTKQHITSTKAATAPPTAPPTLKPTAIPTLKPTKQATTTPLATQPAATPVQYTAGSDRYYPAGTPADTMKTEAANLTKQQVKTLIESQVNKNWSVIQSKLGFNNESQAYAFFLGLATRESTLNAGLETGTGAGHSYGAIQAAETAYSNANPNYAPENDVPEMVQYSFTPQNFYDPGIAIHMGIRHLLHFANQARTAGYTGNELLRHALIGYNTGWVTTSNQSLLQQYSDEIGAIAGWYLNNGHLYDNQFTWTGSSAVDRTNPWGWY